MANLVEKYLKQRTKLTENLQKKIDNQGKKSYADKDEGFWQPSVGKDGNGWSVIRFLPPGGDEEDSYVQYTEYAFQGPTGQWYIEKARTSLGYDEPDPVREVSDKYYALKDETNARKFARKKYHISNILVIQDSEHPENNGKVFLFRYGAQIAKKITEAMNPLIATEPKIDAFDLIEGANFNVVVGRKDKFRTFENSKFSAPSPLVKDLKDLEPILKQCKPLKPFIDPSVFKSYDELKKRFTKVMGGTLPNPTAKEGTVSAAKPATAKATETESAPWDSSDSENLDDILQNLDEDDIT